MALGLPPTNLRVALQLADADFNQRMAGAERRTHSTAASMNRAFARLDRGAQRSFARIGASITALAGTLAALTIGAAVREFTKFEKALSDLSAITGATGKDLRFLSDAAKDLSRTSTQSAASVLRSFQLIASAKPDLLENVDALNEVTKAAITLAEATGQDVAAAGKTLTTALNQFGAGADEAGRFINVLAAGAQKGAVEVDQFAIALQKGGSVARDANISIEQFTAIIQTLAQTGIPLAQIGTSFRNVVIDLLKGADETNPAIVGIDQALENLGERFQTAADFAEEFGKENAIIAKAMSNTAAAAKKLTPAITGTSQAEDQAATRTNNLSGDTDKLLNSFKNLATGMGDLVDGPLRGLIQDITSATNATSGFIAEVNRLSDELDELAARAEDAESPIQRIARALGLSAEGFPVTPGGAAQEGLLQDLRVARLQAQLGTGRGPGPDVRGRRPRIQIELEKTASSGDKAKKAIDKFAQSFAALEQSLDPGAAALADFNEGFALLNEAFKRGVISEERYLDLVNRLERDFEDATSEAEEFKDVSAKVQSIYEATRTPLEKYAAELKDLNDLYKSGALDAETYARAVAQAGEELNNIPEEASAAQEAVEQLGLTFTSAFEDAIVEGKALSDILTGLEQDILRVLTRKLFTEPILAGITSGLEGRVSGPGGFETIFSNVFATASSPFRSGAPEGIFPVPPPNPRRSGGGFESSGPPATVGILGDVKTSFEELKPAVESASTAASTAGAKMGDDLVGGILSTIAVKSTEETVTATATTALIQLGVAADTAAISLAALGTVGGAGGPGEATITNSFGTFFGLSGRQHGGPVRANEGYIVGERGPELLIPNFGGYVFPDAHDISSSRMDEGLRPIVVNINSPQSVPEIRRNMSQIRGSVREMLDHANRRDR